MNNRNNQPLVDAAWLKARLGQPDIVVLDVRTPPKGGFVAGSIHSDYATAGWRTTVGSAPGMLPPPDALERLIGGIGIGNGDYVVLVSSGESAGDIGNATRVYWTFRMLGHDAVSVLDGGFAAWTADAANPVSPTPAARPATRFTARPRTDLRATAAEVEQAVTAGDVPLHDARAPEQFTGAVKSPQARVPGTIPGAAHLESTALYSAADHRFQTPDAIRALAAKAGILPDGAPITFCNTGHQASVSWFALSELAGMPGVRLYDGSMSEWTADPAHPVQTGVEPGQRAGGVKSGGGAAG